MVGFTRFLAVFGVLAAPILGIGHAASTAAAQPGAGGAIAVSGYIASSTRLSADVQRLAIASVDGTFEVDVDGSATITGPSGEPMAPDALRAGLRAAVEGMVRADARVQAGDIAASAPPPTSASGEATVRGRVLATLAAGAETAGRDLAIVADGRSEIVVAVDAESGLVDADGRAIGFAALRAGQAVVLRTTSALTSTVRAVGGTAADAARPTRVRFEGALRARAELADGAERWIVGTVLVEADAATAAGVTASVGDHLIVEAVRDGDGTLGVASALVDVRTAETIELRGTVEAMADAEVTIDGLTLAIDDATAIEGSLVVGGQAEARAVIEADGSLRAETLFGRSSAEVTVAFEGTIDHVGLLGGAWEVDGVTVNVDLLATTITGIAPLPGLHAEVSGTLSADGSVDAELIHVTVDALDGLTVLEGTLTAVGGVPGTWTLRIVDALGAQVSVDLAVEAETIVDESAGAATVGAEAQVTAEAALDGALTARVIRIRPSVR